MIEELPYLRGSVRVLVLPDVFYVTGYQRIYRNWKGDRFIGLAGLHDEGLVWIGSVGIGYHVFLDKDRILAPSGDIVQLSKGYAWKRKK